MNDGPPISTIIWRPTDLDVTSYRPAAEKTVLVYDGYLDDVVMCYLDIQQDWLGVDPVYVWTDQSTGDPLPDPQMWTDVPFPEIIPPVKVGK